MNEKEIIKEALKTVGWTQTMLAQVLGYGSQSGVTQMLSNGKTSGKSMKVETLIKILDVMGYELVVVSKNPNINKNKWKVSVDR